jgi:hypothetical protein
MDKRKFNPDLILEHSDRAFLQSTINTPGFKIMQKIFDSELDKLFMNIVNANDKNAEDVLSAQRMSKAACIFYNNVVAKINDEVERYTSVIDESHRAPEDATEGTLDLDSIEDLPNLLEEAELL